MLVLNQLDLWQRGGPAEEFRSYATEVRCATDGSKFIHVTLRHDFEDNRFKVDREIRVGPDVDTQEALASLVGLLIVEYDEALRNSSSLVSTKIGDSQMVPCREKK